MKTFVLIRDEDETGTSGTGHIAWAVQFPHGLVAVTFRDDAPSGPGVRSCYWYLSMEEAIKVLGNDGKTRFVDVGPNNVEYNSGLLLATADQEDNVPNALFRGAKAYETYDCNEEFVAGYMDFCRFAYGETWRQEGEWDDAPGPERL